MIRSQLTKMDTRKSDDLLKRIVTVIDDTAPFWFDGLASFLARSRWHTLDASFALNSENYGTARHLASNSSARRNELCRLWLSKECGNSRPIIIEALDSEAALRYVKLGLNFYASDALDQGFIKERFDKALKHIAAVPGIARAIRDILAVVHIIEPPGPEYDVSYSDPAVPFSIFVSLCADKQEHEDLRLAEAIIHECMHLQLTLLEEVSPLVNGSSDRYHSPWQGKSRPSQGILHGLYVFRVIDDFAAALLDQDNLETADLSQRRAAIDNEIADIVGCEHSRDLTPLGRRFAHRLLKQRVSLNRSRDEYLP
jgi:hypothetical protein